MITKKEIVLGAAAVAATGVLAYMINAEYKMFKAIETRANNYEHQVELYKDSLQSTQQSYEIALRERQIENYKMDFFCSKREFEKAQNNEVNDPMMRLLSIERPLWHLLEARQGEHQWNMSPEDSTYLSNEITTYIDEISAYLHSQTPAYIQKVKQDATMEECWKETNLGDLERIMEETKQYDTTQ
jgi:hypothetical protein